MDETSIQPSPALDDILAREFPGAANGLYLSSCTRGLLPASARDALVQHLETRMDGSTDKAGMFETIERVRRNFAALIKADADEIAITKNVSEGLSMLANALPWQPGDNVVVCLDLEHPNNLYPWYNLREREGIEVRAIPAQGGHIPADAMIGAIDDRTRLVTV
ncbi:MAG: aminotransferase class V-fold PLP-dependent enzyme, partial [Rhodospirillaceae bacterium]|nr:aminotransferase class V-fold PLP-dependent enzyme [Rhodospirillaceae bacterium]